MTIRIVFNFRSNVKLVGSLFYNKMLTKKELEVII